MHYFRKIDPQNPYATFECGLFEQEVTVAGKKRRFLTYIPDGVRSATAVVMVLGPNHCSVEELLANSGWKELADHDQSIDGLIVFFLEPENGIWNTTEPYGFEAGDVAYVNAVFAKGCERRHYGIHEAKNYLYGVGTGGCIVQMAAMSEPALYAGVATVGAVDVSEVYCGACQKDYCYNLDGFTDLSAKKGIRKGEVPVPVWVIDDPEFGCAENTLNYWLSTNCADVVTEQENADFKEYVRTKDMPYPVNQDKAACRVRQSNWPGAAADYGSVHIKRIWQEFLSRQRRWMADPGGSLRVTRDPIQDLGMERHYEEIGGWMREWYVYVPKSIKQTPEKKVPLVFALHGYSCTGEIYAGNTDWYQVARARGFILIHPTAVPGPLGGDFETMEDATLPLPSWNFLHHIRNGPDEFLFFKEMLRRVAEEHAIDLTRVYATGHSQGSMMVQALAMGMPEMFAAVAPCSGVILGPLYDKFVALPEFNCDVSMPIWMFAGQEEPWLIDAEPSMENATGKTIDLWHRRNQLSGNAADYFQNGWKRYKDRWLDLSYENGDGQLMLRYTQVEYFPHATMPEMSWRIWDELFAHWSRTESGLKYS